MIKSFSLEVQQGNTFFHNDIDNYIDNMYILYGLLNRWLAGSVHKMAGWKIDLIGLCLRLSHGKKVSKSTKHILPQ